MPKPLFYGVTLESMIAAQEKLLANDIKRSIFGMCYGMPAHKTPAFRRVAQMNYTPPFHKYKKAETMKTIEMSDHELACLSEGVCNASLQERAFRLQEPECVKWFERLSTESRCCLIPLKEAYKAARGKRAFLQLSIERFLVAEFGTDHAVAWIQCV